MADALGDIDYPFLLTMDEVLGPVIFHCEQARDTDSYLVMGTHLKMASIALRYAMEIYGSRIGVLREEHK